MLRKLDTDFKGLKENELGILFKIFWHQQEDPNGIRSNVLKKTTPLRGAMNDTAFYNRLKVLLERGLVEKEIIRPSGKREQVYYHIKKEIFDIMCEESIHTKYLLEEVKKQFLIDIKKYKPEAYAAAIIEFLFGRLILVALDTIITNEKEMRDTYYYYIFEDIKGLLEGLYLRTLSSKEDKHIAYCTLLELFQPYSATPLGKQTKLDEAYEFFKTNIP